MLPPALGAACSRLDVAAVSDSSIPPRFPSRRHPSRTGLPGSLLLPPPRGAGRCPVPVPLGCTWLLLALPPIDAGGGPPAPPRPARHGAAAQNLPSSFYGNGGRKKKKKNSKHLILQPTWEPFKLPVRCLTCNNFSAFKIILKRSFSLSLKISAVEPPKEISIKNTDTCRKYQFVTVAGDRQPQAPGKWKGTELHGTGAARGRRWLRADPGHGMGTGWERQHRESWAGGRGQERRWAGC